MKKGVLLSCIGMMVMEGGLRHSLFRVVLEGKGQGSVRVMVGGSGSTQCRGGPRQCRGGGKNEGAW